MGRTYTVPRSAKGESRILYVFTVTGLIFTIAFALVGLLIRMLVASFLPSVVGWVIVGVFAVVGFVIGTLKIPDSNVMGPLRKAGGEKIRDILFRTITFTKRKKIYLYRYNDSVKGEKK